MSHVKRGDRHFVKIAVYLVTLGGRIGPPVVQLHHPSARGVFTMRISPGTVALMTRLGDALEEERRRRGLTQDEAGAALHLSQASFSRYVRGDPIPLGRAITMARWLKMPESVVREMIVETHDRDDEVSPQRSRAARLDALEQAVADLHDALDELRRTPRRGAKRSPDGQHSARS